MKGTLSEVARKSLANSRTKKIVMKTIADGKDRTVVIDKIKYRITRKPILASE